MVTTCADWFAEAQNYIPGGVNSPVRAFRAVGGVPRFIKSAQGAYLIDEENQHYVDYVNSWGNLILGHNHPAILHSIQATLTRGLSFGAPCDLEVALAKQICQLMPSIEKVRMVNSGTEATMSAIRLSRGVTGRDKLVKFEGCYHGHADSLLVKSGSGALTFGVPSSPGVPKAATADTLVAAYNELDSVVALFEEYGPHIAAIMVEPIAANMNMVSPVPGFLSGLRDICDHYGSLLIFDEVITGFRVALGGAQCLYNIVPDVTTLGKIIGGGMPVGAFGGRKEIMAHLSPDGPVYQAGTLSGNPVAMAAGLAALQEIQAPDFYTRLKTTTEHLVTGILQRAHAAKIPLTANVSPGLFGLFFSAEEKITHFEQVMACDLNRFKTYFHAMLEAGIYLAPSAFESGFVSAAHGAEEIAKTFTAVERVFATLIDSRSITDISY